MNRRLRFVIPAASRGEYAAPAVQLFSTATIGVSVAYAVAGANGGAHQPLARLLEGLALSSGSLGEGRWHTLATHWLLQPTLTELGVALVVLLTAGVWVERRIGTGRVTALFAGSGLLTGLLAVMTGTAPVAGALGPALGVLGVAVALDARRGVFWRLSARNGWTALALASLAVIGAFDLGAVPMANASAGAALPITALLFALPEMRSRRAARRYVQAGVAELQAEHAVRDEVDCLLAKISSDGIEALSRRERKVLEQASRFYTGGRRPDAPARVPKPARLERPLGSDPA